MKSDAPCLSAPLPVLFLSHSVGKTMIVNLSPCSDLPTKNFATRAHTKRMRETWMRVGQELVLCCWFLYMCYLLLLYRVCARVRICYMRFMCFVFGLCARKHIDAQHIQVKTCEQGYVAVCACVHESPNNTLCVKKNLDPCRTTERSLFGAKFNNAHKMETW